MVLLAGCSARDPVTQTPVYHIGTPTNRSSVDSWELSQPVNPQQRVYGGKPATLTPIRSQRGFEPDDPAAVAVFNALDADGQVSTQYLSARAKNGVVILAGSVTTAAQKARAAQIARAVPGVKYVADQVQVVHP
jgi:hypothetical protein